MLTLGLDSFAQTNRERNTKYKGGYIDKYNIVHCTCETKIKDNKYINNELIFKCPNLECRNIWAQRIYYAGKLGKLYLKGKYKKDEPLQSKHICNETCVDINYDRTNKTVTIKRGKNCKETIYIAFPNLHKAFILPANMSEGSFIEDTNGINKYKLCNDKDFFYKMYKDYPIIE